MSAVASSAEKVQVQNEVWSTRSLDCVILEGGERLSDPYSTGAAVYYRVTPTFVSWAWRMLEAAKASIFDLDNAPEYLASLSRLLDLDAYAVRRFGLAAVEAEKRKSDPLPTPAGKSPWEVVIVESKPFQVSGWAK